MHGRFADQHLPEPLHAPILEGMKRLVYPSDLSDAIATVGDDFDPVDFDHATMTFANLAHPIIAYVLDPEADDLRHVVIERDGGTPLHALLALGGNSMGFVLDDEGATLYAIYDGSVDLPDGGTETSAEQVALHALIFIARDGQSVVDLKPHLQANDESGYQLLFGS
ncbi:MAG: hypothetical protein ACJARS_001589 [bacterium]|jgi:hypothetical protein